MKSRHAVLVGGPSDLTRMAVLDRAPQIFTASMTAPRQDGYRTAWSGSGVSYRTETYRLVTELHPSGDLIYMWDGSK